MSAAILPRHSALPLLLNTPRGFVRLYGPMIETHLVQRWVSQLVGVEAGVPLAKAMQLAFVLFVAAWWQPWCRALLILCGCLYAAAALSNYFLLL